MTLLTINSGSTSVKLALFEVAEHRALRQLDREQHDGANLDPRQLLGALAARLSAPPQAIAHRVVHGGTHFTQPARIDATVLATIEQLAPLAPLHNPAALRWITAALETWSAVPQAAVFDTAWFAGLPRRAAEYALAADIGVDAGVRRYGFHGLAHEAMWRAWCRLHPQLPGGGRLITLQLGGGCSMTASAAGRPLDTSMGFSPLEGLVMATRSGDVDAAVVPYLEQRLQLPGEKVIELLNSRGGLAGLSASLENPAQLLAEGSAQARFAVELYCYRIRKYVGAYLAVLGGCDGIVFGGGVGEHVPEVRAQALDGLAWAGIELDAALNANAHGGDVHIHSARSTVRVCVVSTDEESVLAEAAAAMI
jgi:acetate kinase